MNAHRRIAFVATIASAAAATLFSTSAAAQPQPPPARPDIPVFTVVVDRAPLRIDVAVNVAEVSANIRAALAERQASKRVARDVEVARADTRANGG